MFFGPHATKSQVTSRTYDALDRATQITYADQSTTSYAWDLRRYQPAVSYAYDNANRLTLDHAEQLASYLGL